MSRQSAPTFAEEASKICCTKKLGPWTQLSGDSLMPLRQCSNINRVIFPERCTGCGGSRRFSATKVFLGQLLCEMQRCDPSVRDELPHEAGLVRRPRVQPPGCPRGAAGARDEGSPRRMGAMPSVSRLCSLPRRPRIRRPGAAWRRPERRAQHCPRSRTRRLDHE